MKTQNADPFQAIAHMHRREMLHLLSKNDLTINSLAENFEMSRPAVSKHIKLLYHAGFITIKDSGRERICTLKKDGFKDLQNWINFFDTFWNTKLDSLGDFLAKSKNKHKSKK